MKLNEDFFTENAPNTVKVMIDGAKPEAASNDRQNYAMIFADVHRSLFEARVVGMKKVTDVHYLTPHGFKDVLGDFKPKLPEQYLREDNRYVFSKFEDGIIMMAAFLAHSTTILFGIITPKKIETEEGLPEFVKRIGFEA